MLRKLVILDLVLLALIVLAGQRLRDRYQAAREREQRLLGAPVKPAPGQPAPAMAAAQPLTAAGYLEVAQRILFSRDRNPNVEIIPPPVKVMPPLPVAHGVLLFGEPTVILSEKTGSPHHGYRQGERIGPFKVLAVNNVNIEFEWDGRKVVRSLDELREKEALKIPEQALPPPPAPAAAAVTNLGAAGAGTPKGPGDKEMGAGLRSCSPGDSTPAGAVVDGYKKVVSQTPFGAVCRWEQVK